MIFVYKENSEIKFPSFGPDVIQELTRYLDGQGLMISLFLQIFFSSLCKYFIFYPEIDLFTNRLYFKITIYISECSD